MNFRRWLAVSFLIHFGVAGMLWAIFGASGREGLVIDLTASSFTGAVYPGRVVVGGVETPAAPDNGGKAESQAEESGMGDGGGKLTALPQLRDRDRMREKLGRFYPPRARERGEEGVVLLEVVVTASGRVTEAKVLEARSPEFSGAAVKLARELAFSPALVGGRAVAVRIRLPVRFELER